ncbi:NUMOD4 domain-containing protein [Chryseobacterium daecheongense]|uniref:NUMOD4 domain-containing protein n=1 Tax=Chryseobacterium daecheongense TaxID=192389 RepID=UPI001FD65DE8|nr:NUMOD4 domain-containing protein [Chryseobacterium daecheongense]UOU98190.1 NUMOD4 domain-containing protein [Chryseobacterium daecheongense]
MNPPPEIQDPYVREVLCNTSLKNLPGEEWKPIENFENYAISNYGRLKSLERWTRASNGKEWKQSEKIMQLIFVKQFNSYLQSSTYQVHCSLSSEGEKYRKSIPRLVYYHFIEKFDLSDRSIVISFKDDNRFHVHSSNLEKISGSERCLKIYRSNRARNRNVIYQQAVSQYTVEGEWVADFESMYDAATIIGVGPESIMDVIHKEFLTAGGFRWFLQSEPPKEKDFLITPQSDTSDRILNKSLWEKLGKPVIDMNNPPACMNLSLTDLPDERWKPVPGFEDHYVVSDKGRVKRLSGWISTGRKIFLKEQILSLIMNINDNGTYSLYPVLSYNGKMGRIGITKLVYYCFVEKFDLYSKTLFIINYNNPQWDMDISKLSLRSVYSVLKGKEKEKPKK